MSYSYAPFDTLLSGNVVGSMVDVYVLSIGSIFFTIVFAAVLVLIYLKTQNFMAVGVGGVIISLPMVAFPDGTKYLGPEGQMLAFFLLVFSIMIVVIKIAVKKR